MFPSEGLACLAVKKINRGDRKGRREDDDEIKTVLMFSLAHSANLAVKKINRRGRKVRREDDDDIKTVLMFSLAYSASLAVKNQTAEDAKYTEKKMR